MIAKELAHANVYRIRRIVLASIEDPYTVEQLREPRMNVLIVKPLVDRLYNKKDVSVGTSELSMPYYKLSAFSACYLASPRASQMYI